MVEGIKAAKGEVKGQVLEALRRPGNSVDRDNYNRMALGADKFKDLKVVQVVGGMRHGREK